MGGYLNLKLNDSLNNGEFHKYFLNLLDIPNFNQEEIKNEKNLKDTIQRKNQFLIKTCNKFIINVNILNFCNFLNFYF